MIDLNSNKPFDYDRFFSVAKREISQARDSNLRLPDQKDLGMDIVISNKMLDFDDRAANKYFTVMQITYNSTIKVIKAIILALISHHQIKIESVSIPSNNPLFSGAFLVFKTTQDNAIYIFKEIEQSPLWFQKDNNPELEKFKNKNHATSVSFIYLLKEYAYLQIINHNNDETDISRGTLFYPLHWFFNKYFSSHEYDLFLSKLQNFKKEVSESLDYSVVRSLTPRALINFKKIIQTDILQFSFEKIVSEKIIGKYEEYSLSESDYHLLNEQFLSANSYQILLGTHYFAESFITAEWLRNSLKSAKAIDLTVIGTGYFKAAEQFIFDLICLHKGENRTIQRHPSKKNLPYRIPLTETNIEHKNIDTTLGAMSDFIKNNLDILRDDLSPDTRYYIKETLFAYKDLRNGYFHKDNIHDLDTIIKIHDSTLNLFFLFIGGSKLSQNNLLDLGFSSYQLSDYQKLCEYVHYHKDHLFIIENNPGEQHLLFGTFDPNPQIVNNRFIHYSGVYFREFLENKPIVMKEEILPRKISRGKLIFGSSAKTPITIQAEAIETVFEDGKFIGSSILLEPDFDY